MITSLILLHSGRVEDADEDADADADADDNMLIDDDTMDVGSASVTLCSPAFVTFDCPENHCTMQFRREDRLHAHLLLDSHKIIVPSFRLLDKAIIMYKAGLQSDNHKHVPHMSVNNNDASAITATDDRLAEGWALLNARPRVPFTIQQRSYLDEKYNEGEKSGAKWDAASVAEVSHLPMRTLFLQSSVTSFRTCSPLKSTISSSFNQINSLSHHKLSEPERLKVEHTLYLPAITVNRSYFSRMTRERRTKGNDARRTVSASFDEEAQQQQEEDDENDFDSAITVSQADDLMDDAIEVLDSILQQQTQPATNSSTAISSVTTTRGITRNRRVPQSL